eukprot:2235085-Pyramimonas_sp.AAC.1
MTTRRGVQAHPQTCRPRHSIWDSGRRADSAKDETGSGRHASCCAEFLEIPQRGVAPVPIPTSANKMR